MNIHTLQILEINGKEISTNIIKTSCCLVYNTVRSWGVMIKAVRNYPKDMQKATTAR